MNSVGRSYVAGADTASGRKNGSPRYLSHLVVSIALSAPAEDIIRTMNNQKLFHLSDELSTSSLGSLQEC